MTPVEVIIEDGIVYLQNNPGKFDVILVDSTEPVGPAVGLFTEDFYRLVYAALRPGGILVAQTESPFYNADILVKAYTGMKAVFPGGYIPANIPTYPSGTVELYPGNQAGRSSSPSRQPAPDFASRYYTPELHSSCFVLPRFVGDMLEKAR